MVRFWVYLEDPAGFVAGLDAGRREKDEFLFGAQAGGKMESPFMELGEIAGKARLRKEIGSCVYTIRRGKTCVRLAPSWGGYPKF